MRIKYRLYGMMVCLILLLFASIISIFYPSLRGSMLFIIFFVAGYALRESLDHEKGGAQ